VFDINLGEGNAFFFEVVFEALAVSAPLR
jgi:hypothetical protein